MMITIIFIYFLFFGTYLCRFLHTVYRVKHRLWKLQFSINTNLLSFYRIKFIITSPACPISSFKPDITPYWWRSVLLIESLSYLCGYRDEKSPISPLFYPFLIRSYPIRPYHILLSPPLPLTHHLLPYQTPFPYSNIYFHTTFPTLTPSMPIPLTFPTTPPCIHSLSPPLP